MRNYHEHIIFKDSPMRLALEQLNFLGVDGILFVTDSENRLIGSLTDGDVRRGLLKGLDTNNEVEDFIQPNPKFIRRGSYVIEDIINLREKLFRIIPVLDKDNRIINVINFRFLKSYLPVDAVIMAGGRGSRLSPLTDVTPKPMLIVGDKPIIEHNIDRLIKFGIDDIYLSLRYLGEQIEDYFGNGDTKGVRINHVWETEALGTIGALTMIQDWQHDYVLVTNSDVLTSLDYEDFFLDFLNKDADMSVVTIPYNVNIPYAVIETSNHHVLSFKEKPTYTYYSNGGIYLIKRELLEMIPKNQFYDATDLMQKVLENGNNLISYPMRQYWLDIGRPADYEKAQEDIKHLHL